MASIRGWSLWAAFLFGQFSLASLPSSGVCAPIEYREMLAGAPSVRAAGVSGNTAPGVSAPSMVTIADGEYVSITAEAFDPDASDVLTLSVVGAPPGFDVTTTNGPGSAMATISGTVDSGESSTFIVAWVARDGVNPPATASTLGTVSPEVTPAVVPGKVLVDLLAGDVVHSSGLDVGEVGDFEFSPPWLRARLEELGATRMRRLFPWLEPGVTAAVSVEGDSMVLPMDLSRVYEVEIPGRDPSTVAGNLKGLSEAVRTAEPSYYRHATSTIPNDPRFSQQWGLLNTGQASGGGCDIRATHAWDVTTGTANPIRVGIIDGGIDLEHPDLAPIESGPNFFSSGPPDEDCGLSHGTAVAGIIAARGNNGIGVSGVSWGATPVAIKVGGLPDYCYGLDGSAILQGVDWARAAQVPIINCSFGGASASEIERATYKNAHAAGMLIVAGTGNEDGNYERYPAAFKAHVEAVGAVLPNGRRWGYSDPGYPAWGGCYGPGVGSNYGSWIDLAAPGGERIATTRTLETGSYYFATDPFYCGDSFGGTSASAPVVAGVASLIKSFMPSLTGEDLSEVMHRTATDVIIYGSGWDQFTGWGVPDAAAGLDFLTTQPGGRHRYIQQGVAAFQWEDHEDAYGLLMYDVPGLSDGAKYFVKRHEVRSTVTFSPPFDSPPDMWCKGYGSVGWRPVEGSYQYLYEPTGWSEVVPGTLTRLGCDVRTYIYEVFTALGVPVPPHFWPAQRAAARMAWTAVGNMSPTAVEPTTPAAAFAVKAYPNPTSREFLVGYTIPGSGVVTLRMFDAVGRQVAKGQRTHASGGSYEIRTSEVMKGGKHLPSGVYFYRLDSAFGAKRGRIVVAR